MTQDYPYDDADYAEEIEIEAIGIEVSSQPIELYKVFKIANLVSGGGEAKHVIAEGYVAVNGELETRKRRKMYDGDFFEFNQEYYVVVCDAPVIEPEAVEQEAEKPLATARKEKSRQNKAAKPKGTGPKSTGRKAAHKERKAQKNALSQAAGKGKKTEKPEATRDPSSGRNSIDFF